MTVLELIERLEKHPFDMEVRVMNVSIDDHGFCPTFEVKGVAPIETNDGDIVTIEINY